jgi:MFS family permease
MRLLEENHRGFSTVLAFALIPLSGFATDIYLPSLPSMARELKVSPAAVQLTLILFMLSTGVSQIFIGSILDSFGRFKLSIISLLVFSVTNFVIAIVPEINVIYLMRVLQGVSIAFIIVGKRAYFVDLYTGEKLKGYISLFAIIWSCAPIVAPFIGGYLQELTGSWRSNFYFLGCLSSLFLVLELVYSGESTKYFHAFTYKSVLKTYRTMLNTADFSLGLLMIGACFGLVIIYNFSSPFIIERIFGHSSIATGYSSLLSGLSVMTGGIVARAVIRKSIIKKISIGVAIQIIVVFLMIILSTMNNNFYSLVGFTIGLHISGGFIFNIIYGYCLGRFSNNAGIASGLTGGAMYVISSLFSYGFTSLFAIKSQSSLGLANATLIASLVVLFIFFVKTKKNRIFKEILQY